MSNSRRTSSSGSDNLNQAYDDAEEIIREGSVHPGNIARFKAILDRKPNLTVYNHKVGRPNRWREPLLGIAISENEEPFVKALLDKRDPDINLKHLILKATERK